MMCRYIFLLWLVCNSIAIPAYAQDKPIRVGAKHFNEGYILSEMIALILEDGGYTVERKFNLGGTAVSFEALRTEAIDVYPEYTGTLAMEILKQDRSLTMGQIQEMLQEKFKLAISEPYGFNNTYALVMTKAMANKLQMNAISDLVNYPQLKAGISYEFLERNDGWKHLAAHYHLHQEPVGLEHGLAYQALREQTIHITDAYSTDGEIARYDLKVLDDDEHFFPEYKAVSFYRASLPAKAKSLLAKLTGTITDTAMQRMNAQALFNHKSHREIAQQFLIAAKLINNSPIDARSDWQVLQKAGVHIKLTLLALIAAIVVALPLGIYLYRYAWLAKAVLYITGILQTIPSIALLALMIPLAGIGMMPAVIALFLYALLPILRNTMIGLFTVDPMLKKVAVAMGMNTRNRLRYVEIPLAMPMILAGIRTAAVINIGTATLAAFIGAGGLGEYIVTGLALNNTSMILTGAMPAALLAIVFELVFEAIELIVIPKHLRQKIG